MDEEMLAFWRARLDEDEATARATAPSGRRLAWREDPNINEEGTPVYWVISDPNPSAVAHAMGLERGTGGAVAAHIALHDPARTLREVAADRRLLMRYQESAIHLASNGAAMPDANLLAALAAQGAQIAAIRDRIAIYGSHPAYRQEWAP